MTHNHDIFTDFAPVFAVGFILLIAFLISAWAAITRNWLTVFASLGAMGFILIFGKAVFEAEGAAILASGMARSGAGIGAGVVKAAPWIAGGVGIFGLGRMIMHISEKVPAWAFALTVAIAVCAISATAAMLWAKTANLIVCGAVATVFGLVALCAWLSIILTRHDLARMELAARARDPELLAPASTFGAPRIAASPKQIEVHKGNLPVVRR